MNANDFIKLLGIGGKKKATGTRGTTGGGGAPRGLLLPEGPFSVFSDIARSIAPPGMFQPRGPQTMQGGYAPGGAPVPVTPGGSGSSSSSDAQWLSMALAAMGGGPDRSAYVTPFDAAEQRARQAQAAAVPQIAQGYDRMRGELAQAQGVTDRDAGAAREQMAAVQAALQSQMAQGNGAIMRDLASQGGTPALGGLLGAAQAQAGTSQAQLAQKAATQQQLSGNMQAASTAAYKSRLADSQLAQGAATSNSQNTLNQVLAQLDSKKASALQAYAQDSQQYQSKVAQTKMAAMERQQARAEKEADPMRAIQIEKARLDLDERKAEIAARSTPAGASGAAKREWETWNDEISKKNPVSYDVLYSIMESNDSYATAVADLNKKIASKQVKTKGGKQLNATFLRDRLREAYDIYDRMESEKQDDEQRKSDSRKSRSRK